MSGKLTGSLENGQDSSFEVNVPFYGLDFATIGKARVQGQHIEIDLFDPRILPFLKENLVGLSVMYLDTDRVDDLLNKKEKTDGTT